MISDLRCTIHEEAMKDGKTYDIVASIRSRRLKWLGQILLMDEDRLLHKTVKEIYHNRKNGDILMDAPVTKDWKQLIQLARKNKGADWNILVRQIKDMIFVEAATNKKKKKSKCKGKRKNKRKSKSNKSSKRATNKKSSGDAVSESDGEPDSDDEPENSGRGRRSRHLRSLIICRDGFHMSVQASRHHYCMPRKDKGPYSHVEVGYPSEWEDLLIPFADTSAPMICGMRPDLYVKVPGDIVRAVIIKHGGMAPSSGALPPLSTNRWAAAAAAAAASTAAAAATASIVTTAETTAEVTANQSTEEEEDTEEMATRIRTRQYGSPSSMIQLGRRPPPPPPQRDSTATATATESASTTLTGAIIPSTQLLQTTESPIRHSSRRYIDKEFEFTQE